MNLIDFINPFSGSADSITLVSVLIIMVVAILSIGYLLLAFFQFRKFFSQDAHEIADSEKLKDLIFEFKSGLIDVNGQKKSFNSFHNKVGKAALLNLFFNDKVLNSISNMLVGLGILGTFLGLSKGVSGFVMDSTDTIKDSIGSLLGGMGTAFISSIWGMLSSLVFIFVYQLVRHAVARKTDRFYASMDQAFLITELEHVQYQEEQLKKSLREVVKEYFVQEEEGIERAPKYYYREILLNSRNQTLALSSFADDLARLMEDMIEKLLDINTNKFKEIIEQKLVPILEQLLEVKAQGTSDVLKEVLNALKDAMKEMLNDFKESISGETKGEMAQLAITLGKVTEALESMPSDIQGLSEDLTENMKDLAETIKIVVMDIYKDQDRSEIMRKATQDEASEKLKSILDGVGKNVGSLLAQQSGSAEKLAEVLEIVDGVVAKNNQSIESFRQLLSNSRETFTTMQTSSHALSEASTSLVAGSKAIESNNKEVKEAVQTFVSSNNDSIEKIRSLQLELTSRTNEFLAQFSKMEDGIDAVFEQFNEGLEGYTHSLNDALSGSIGKYTDSSKSAIEAINGLTRELTDSVEGLTEVLSKTRS